MIHYVLYFMFCSFLYVYWIVNKFFWIRSRKIHTSAGVSTSGHEYPAQIHECDPMFDFFFKPLICCIPIVNIGLFLYVTVTSYGGLVKHAHSSIADIINDSIRATANQTGEVDDTGTDS